MKILFTITYLILTIFNSANSTVYQLDPQVVIDFLTSNNLISGS